MRHAFLSLIAAALLVASAAPLSAEEDESTYSEIVFEEVRRPSMAFLDEGDAAGFAPGAFEKLEIVPGRSVTLTAPNGNVIGVPTRIHGARENAVYIKQTLRNALDIEDGEMDIRVQGIEWPRETEGGQAASFTEVVRPPVAFLEYGDAVGLSIVDMRELGAGPGMMALLEGPGGSAEVNVRLQGRGPGAILMRQTLRNRIGVEDGPDQEVSLTMLQSETDPAELDAIVWHELTEGAALARRTGRPLLIVVEGERAGAVRAAVESSEVRPLAAQCVLTSVDPEAQAAVAARFGVGEETAVVFATGMGQTITRIEGEVTTAMLQASAEAALAEVRDD